MVGFQSPCGDFGFRNLDYEVSSKRFRRFSPLAGILVLETWRYHITIYSIYTCFSPLAGILVLETLNGVLDTTYPPGSFSPLAGILVLETENRGLCYVQI